MASDSYRVVLTGDLVNGFAREAVTAALARFFETSAGRLVGLFDGEEFPVDEIMSAADALALQEKLQTLGAVARIERVGTQRARADQLHLPHHGEVSAGLMHCPACGHKQLVAERCDECGVVFADYNRASRAEKQGRQSTDRRPAVQTRPAPKRPAAPQRPPPADIHARADNGWHDAWVDDGDELPTEQFHVNMFMGRHGTALAADCKKRMLGRRTHLSLSWAGGAVISPFLWALYHKMWAWGMLIFVAEIVLPVLLIAFGSKPHVSDKLTYLGIAGIVANRIFWPAILKYLYCRHARNMIAYMNRMSPTYASDIDIAAAGGTSKTSAFAGIVLAIVVALLTWNIVDTVSAKLMKENVAFSEPPTTTWQPPAAQELQPATKPADDALVTENRWVATRNRLRILGQRLTTWFGAAGTSVDPASLGMADIANALLLDADSTIDGWGKQFRYRYEEGGFLLSSAGPDGEFGNNDDVKYRRSLNR